MTLTDYIVPLKDDDAPLAMSTKEFFTNLGQFGHGGWMPCTPEFCHDCLMLRDLVAFNESIALAWNVYEYTLLAANLPPSAKVVHMLRSRPSPCSTNSIHDFILLTGLE